MASIDLKKTYRDHYAARVGKPALAEVPPRPYLMIDGKGDPNTSQDYADAIGSLYPIAYGLRAAIKKVTGDGYAVMPLEGLWWADEMSTFSVDEKGSWKWTMMICQPELVTPDLATEVIPAVIQSKKLVAGERVRFATYGDGLSAQVMHVGPYAAEAPTIELLHEFIATEQLALSGKHHEIYLGDPRKADPSKLKTIIRQPVARV